MDRKLLLALPPPPLLLIGVLLVPFLSQSASSHAVPPSLEKVRQACLDAHNQYRRAHGCPYLQPRKDLDAAAQEWAEYLAQVGHLTHDRNTNQGENLYFATTFKSLSEAHGKEAVNAWYGEISRYQFGRNEWIPSTGHFTQVIWRNSQYLGVGAVQKGQMIYIVARYSPAGNVIGHFLENVPPPTGATASASPLEGLILLLFLCLAVVLLSSHTR